MHAHEIESDAALVRRLLADQFPEWAGLPIARVESTGTVNALYRLGDDMVVRMPRTDWARGAIERDVEWLPRLAPLLPVEIPLPLAKGEPGHGYPRVWGVYTWLEGETAPSDRYVDSDAFADDVTRVVDALRSADVRDAPPVGRASLEARDESTRSAIALLEREIDAATAERLWDGALAVAPAAPVCVHADLLPGNVLVRGGRLTGVIDWESSGLGEPAFDLVAGWSLLPSPARERFRATLGIDDETWLRGQGWALSVGLLALPYYRETNPSFAALARRLIDETLANVRSV